MESILSLEKTTQKTTQKLNHNQLKIIEIIKEHPKVTKKKWQIFW